MVQIKLKMACIGIVLYFMSANIAHAQYNKNFAAFYNTGWVSQVISGNARDIVVATPGTQMVLSTLTDLPKEVGYNSFDNIMNLKKIDDFGNTIWDRTYRISDSTNVMEPRRLIRADDYGFIIAGRIRQRNGIYNPFAMRVDSSGNIAWTNIYQSNQVHYQDEEETSIVRVEDDTAGSESYIIVRSGSSGDSVSYPNDISINALRITGNGALLWNKKFPFNPSGRPVDDTSIWCFPKTITYVPDSSQGHFYFIAGTELNRKNNSQYSSLFYTGINKNGNYVRSYMHTNTGGWPLHEDAIYDSDPIQQCIVMAYSNTKNGLVDPQQISNRSQIGLIKLDKQLGIVQNRYFYGQYVKENQVARLRRTLFDDGYMIAGNMLDTPRSTDWNIMMFLTDKAFNPQFYANYNFLRYNHANSMTVTDPGNNDQSYVIVGHRASVYSTGLTDKRVMKVDGFGNTCGVNYYGTWDTAYTLSPINRDALEHQISGYWSTDWNEVYPDYFAENCTPDNAPYFKQAGPSGPLATSGNNIAIFPTLLHDYDHEITIRSAFTLDEVVQANLYSIEGRKIAEGTFNIGSGTNIVKWSLPQMAPGTYVVDLMTKEGKRISTVRITKM